MFMQVLLGEVPARADLADINGDGRADGNDIQLFIDRLLAPPP